MATKLFKNIKFYNKIDSTNLEAKRFIKNGKIDCNTVLLRKPKLPERVDLIANGFRKMADCGFR
ncbi:MAG: hypothetical protein H8E33_01790 [Candidatus Cloacimonetes bacterium]|nr:hypothetical protein [Candidatus Cloacimonadota bacterium]